MRRYWFFVLPFVISALSGCALFKRDPVDPEALRTLAKRGVLGYWRSDDGSEIRFGCNGAVSVTIVPSDREDPAKNFFGSDRWTGGMTSGSGTVTGFVDDEIAVQAMLGTHHWHIDRFPANGSMTLENLRFEARATTDCRDEW